MEGEFVTMDMLAEAIEEAVQFGFNVKRQECDNGLFVDGVIDLPILAHELNDRISRRRTREALQHHNNLLDRQRALRDSKRKKAE